jgi:23S rRNA pseudouridine1911/1915/1917 synthase
MANLETSRAQRLDQKVVELLPELSRAFAAKLIERGSVKVNGEIETKAGYKLRDNDTVAVDYTPELEQVIPDIDLPVLYEDDDCVVINKPVGVLTHSKGAFNPEATVATWLRRRLAKGEWVQHSDKNGNARAGIVHRLDRATSGVMICAKNPEALSKLQKQFSQRKAKKTYDAIVPGQLPHEHAIIDMPIERNPKKPQTFRVGVNGKAAVTEYRVLQTTDAHSELKLSPQTGRTHQLRVHLSQIGHPIVGDVLYGGSEAPRLFLHALSLEITLPNRERREFTAPLPPEFKQFMEQKHAS